MPPELLCPAVESFMGLIPSRVRRWTARKRVLASQKEYTKAGWVGGDSGGSSEEGQEMGDMKEEKEAEAV